MDEKPIARRRPLGLGRLRMKATQYADDALEALKTVAANAEADPQSRVQAAKALIGYATEGAK